MKFHGIKMKGALHLQEVASLPTWQASDERRIVYNQADGLLYYADDTAWKPVGTGTGGGGIDYYFYNTSTSAASANFDSFITSPTSGSSFAIVDKAQSFGTNNFTLNGPVKINGVEWDNIVCDVNGLVLGCIYTGDETYGWNLDIGGLSTLTAVVSGETSSGGGSINFIEFTASDLDWDDDKIDIEQGELFGMIDSISFAASGEGAVWGSKRIADGWDTSKDLKVKIIHSLDTYTSGACKVVVRMWVIGENGTANSAYPDAASFETITGYNATNIGKLNDYETNCVISGGTYGDTPLYLVVYFERDGNDSSDTYDGRLELASIVVEQGE